jgi:hypothetical protein
MQKTPKTTTHALPSNFHIIPIEMPLKNAGIFCYELSNSNAPNYCAIPYPTDREKKKKKSHFL